MNVRKITNLLIIIALILVLVIIGVLINKKAILSGENGKEVGSESSEITMEVNNETGMYEIKDETTGEVITTVNTEEDAKYELEFYKEHPDYRANPPVSPNTENEIY